MWPSPVTVQRVQGFIVPATPPDPPKPSFFRALTDVWQPILTIGAAIVLITRLQSSIEHEGDLRRVLETRLVEMMAQIAVRQADNAIRFDQRFAENAARDREVFIELKSGLSIQSDKIDRLSSKLDVLSTAYTTGQSQLLQQRNPR